MFEILEERIGKNRKRLEMAEKRKDYAECLKVQGRIFELELWLLEVASQERRIK